MSGMRELIRPNETVLIPGAHDAISARMIEDAGFKVFGIGGSALAATQLALPDIGLQSFGEYRDSVSRVLGGSTLPAMVDGENGFGDVKAVTRTVRSFEAMGIAGISLEDLSFPPVLGVPPSVISESEMTAKLEAALAARQNPGTFIIGRTDAAGILGLDAGISRAGLFEDIGVDAVLLTGVQDKEGLKRVRDSVSVPVIAIIVENGPWATATPGELTAMGYEFALYPASLMLAGLTGYSKALEAIGRGSTSLPTDSIGHAGMRTLVRPDEWAAVDARALATNR